MIRAMDRPHAVDGLGPEVRFALRFVAAGRSLEAAAAQLKLDPATLRKHLRTALRELAGSAPPPAAGDAALDAALLELLPAARVPSARTPSRACPGADVADALARGRLDGPLLLGEIEHAADCPACLAGLIASQSRD
jgi:hypothetical protein